MSLTWIEGGKPEFRWIQNAGILFLIVMGTTLVGCLTSREPAPEETADFFARSAREHYRQAHSDHLVSVQAAENAFALHANLEKSLLKKIADTDTDAVARARKCWNQSKEKCETVLKQLVLIQMAVERARQEAETAEAILAKMAADADNGRKQRKAVGLARAACKEAEDARKEIAVLTAKLKEAWLIPDYGNGPDTGTTPIKPDNPTSKVK
jgi:hypothetical protein